MTGLRQCSHVVLSPFDPPDRCAAEATSWWIPWGTMGQDPIGRCQAHSPMTWRKISYEEAAALLDALEVHGS